MAKVDKNYHMAKTKIAHIITQLELGGAQKSTLSLLKHIDKKYYEVHLISSPGGPLEKDALSLPGVKVLLLQELVREPDLFKDLVSLFKIAAYLKREKISLVHTHSSKAGIVGRWAARLAGISIIFHTVHGWPFYIRANRIIRLLYLLLEKISSWITTKIIVVSETDLNVGIRRVNNRRDKYEKIYYGIEKEGFCSTQTTDQQVRLEIKRSLGITADSCVVGYVACLKPQKAPLDFVKVAKAVIDKRDDVIFISIGDGSLRRDAEALASELSLNGQIKFLGWQQDIAKFYSIMDILILTSYWEGFPVVFIEAMASGVPVVTTRVGGAEEIIKPGTNGFIEEEGSYQDIANDIVFLAANPERGKEFSVAARDTFTRIFDISTMAQQTQTLYNQTIRRSLS